MNQQITNEQEFDLSVSFKTAAGNPAVITGSPVWANTDSSVATLDVSPDGLTAVVTSGQAGGTTITVLAQTSGGGTIEGTFDVSVVLAEADQVVFTVANIRFKSSGTISPIGAFHLIT